MRQMLDSYEVDIVIINFNAKRYLEQCLNSIKCFTPVTDCRIWVVDNASTDGSQNLIKSKHWVYGIFNTRNMGYAKACNQGIRQGNGKYIFLFNNDIKVTVGWLPPLIKTLGSSPQIAVVGPRLVNPMGFLVGVGVMGTNAHPVLRGWGEPDNPESYRIPCECLSVCGACFGIKRELIPSLGLFDEHYFHYFEETDYCFNARYHGYKVIYCPDSKVIHQVNGSCRNYKILNRYFEEGKQYFQKKWSEFLKDETIYNEVPFKP